MRLWALGTALVAIGTASAFAQPECSKDNPKVVASCFTVHGRLTPYNGAWPFVIWIVGTSHNLAVVDVDPAHSNEMDALPNGAAKLLLDGQPNAVEVFGDYQVCPLSKYQQGLVQYVCVESASRLVPRKGR